MDSPKAGSERSEGFEVLEPQAEGSTCETCEVPPPTPEKSSGLVAPAPSPAQGGAASLGSGPAATTPAGQVGGEGRAAGLALGDETEESPGERPVAQGHVGAEAPQATQPLKSASLETGGGHPCRLPPGRLSRLRTIFCRPAGRSGHPAWGGAAGAGAGGQVGAGSECVGSRAS